MLLKKKIWYRFSCFLVLLSPWIVKASDIALVWNGEVDSAMVNQLMEIVSLRRDSFLEDRRIFMKRLDEGGKRQQRELLSAYLIDNYLTMDLASLQQHLDALDQANQGSHRNINFLICILRSHLNIKKDQEGKASSYLFRCENDAESTHHRYHEHFLLARAEYEQTFGQKAVSVEQLQMLLVNSLSDEKLRPVILNELNVSLNWMSHHHQALTHLKAAERICIDKNYPNLLAKTYSNLGQTYVHLDDRNRALAYYKKASLLRIRATNVRGLGFAIFNMGMYLLKNEQFEIARYAFTQSAEFFHSIGYPRLEEQARLTIGQTYPEEGDLEKTISFYKDLASRQPEGYSLLRSYAELINALESAGRLREALGFARKLNGLNTKLNLEKLDGRVSVLKTELMLNQSESALKNTRRIMFFGATIFSLLCVLILSRLHSKARRTKMIEGSLEQKENMIREIHHRVKNNLQIIASLLNLQGASFDDLAVKNLIDQSKNRIHAMSLVHEQLYRTSADQRVSVKAYIPKICLNLQQVYAAYHIKFSFRLDDLNVSIEDGISLGLIITEIISNSLKHAFTNQVAGEIEIVLILDHEYYSLLIGDNGCGMASNEIEEQSASFGLELIRMLATKLSARLSISAHSGTSVRLEVPRTSQIDQSTILRGNPVTLY